MEVSESVEKVWRKYCEESDGSYMLSKSSFVYALKELEVESKQPTSVGGDDLYESLNEIHTMLAKSELPAEKYQPISFKILKLKQAILRQREQQESGKWISVEDRLPENENWMRVCINGFTSVIPCSYAGIRWFEYGSYASLIPEVSHWKEFTDENP